MSAEKGKRTRKKGLFQNYVIYIISFLIIALAVFVAALFIAEKPVTEFVHKLEDSLNMNVRDVQINDDSYYLNGTDDISASKINYGDKIGNISIESCGVNCSVYYGSNRASMRYGTGLAEDSISLDNDSKVKFVKGYDETYFAGLKYAEIGDIITVDTNIGKYEYRITDAKYIDADASAYQSEDYDMLVLCSICSDFSDHSGECFYVFADRINGEDR